MPEYKLVRAGAAGPVHAGEAGISECGEPAMPHHAALWASE
jgi:hypothetical protein